MKFSFSISMVTITVILSLFFLGCNKKESKLIVNTKEVTEITTYSAECGGTVNVIGNYTIGACGVCWSETPSPTINDFFTTDNQGSGEFSSSMKNLYPGTKYYVRAYATTSSGIIYGDEKDFTTEALPVASITIYTYDVSEITASSAKCGGVVTANGDVFITARGVCWSTSQNPTTNDFHTTDGQGIGAFTSILSGLTASTPYYIRAYATTSDGNTTYGDPKTFTTASGGGGGGGEITVTVYTNEVTEITDCSAKCGGIVTANGNATITARGVYWSTSQDFTLNVSHTSDGQGLGSFTSNLTGLTANASYYVKAYATTSDGNTVYSNEIKTFTTLDVPGPTAELPTVEIGNVSDITGTSAKCSGNVTSDGGASVTERGICWSTSQNPMVYHSHIACGSGTGSFIGDLTGLTSGTTYYVRAYATNSEGTNYSREEKTFTASTLTLPMVTTLEVTDITQTSATGGGNVTDDGGSTVISRGLCWSTFPNPTIETGSSITCGSGTGTFTGQITDLTSNTPYYAKAFATNSVGTAYGNEVSFTTSPSNAWLFYDDGIELGKIGLTNGGTIQWAIMLPSSMISQYNGYHITKIGVYVETIGEYNLKIYKGGTSSPSTQLVSYNYTLSQTGWRYLFVDPSLDLDGNQSLWVSLTITQEAGEYPATYSEGSNHPNARWINNNSSWVDVTTLLSNTPDLSWMIRVYVTNESKRVFDQELVMPTSPKQSNRNTPQKTSTEAIPTNISISTKMRQ